MTHREILDHCRNLGRKLDQNGFAEFSLSVESKKVRMLFKHNAYVFGFNQGKARLVAGEAL